MKEPRALKMEEWPEEIKTLFRKTNGQFLNYWDSRVSWKFEGSTVADLVHIVATEERDLYDMEFYLNGDIGPTMKAREEGVHPEMFQDYFEHITKLHFHY